MLATNKQIKKDDIGVKNQFNTIFLKVFFLTVFIPFKIPTPLTPPIMQYVVETGIPIDVKNHTHKPAPNCAEKPERGSKAVIPFPIVSVTL